jgi:hypothetical protein
MDTPALPLIQLLSEFLHSPDDTVRGSLERTLQEWQASPEALDVCLNIISTPGFQLAIL